MKFLFKKYPEPITQNIEGIEGYDRSNPSSHPMLYIGLLSWGLVGHNSYLKNWTNDFLSLLESPHVIAWSNPMPKITLQNIIKTHVLLFSIYESTVRTTTW